MAKDPAFLFYPGDYLRDTQCLSESVQVAYDRIMCEHMRNICISQQQLNFFTKRLSQDEKSELDMVLTKVDGGFQIGWVAESICKRKDYSESRRLNRKGKTKEDVKNISDTYVEHMENENENVIEDITVIKKEEPKTFQKPSELEIQNYLLTKYPDASIEGIKTFTTKFWSHYENNGWKVGKNKMKSWKLAFAQWDETIQKLLFPNLPTKTIEVSQNHKNIEVFSQMLAALENPQTQIQDGINP